MLPISFALSLLSLATTLVLVLTIPWAIVASLPLFLFSLYLLVGRFIVKSRAKQQLFYVITNYRIFVLSQRPDGSARKLSHMNLTYFKDEFFRSDLRGIGTIYLGEAGKRYAMYLNAGLDRLAGFPDILPLALVDIDDCAAVYQIYQNAKRLAYAL